jgi:heptosyltransferase III
LGLRSYGVQEIILVGGKGEQKIAEEIQKRVPEVSHRVGLTTLHELFEIIQSSRLVIGGDSSPMHIADLTHTPCLNLSFESVNFWETGPRSAESRVLFFISPDTVDIRQVVDEALSLILQEPSRICLVRSPGVCSFYELLSPVKNEFEWSLLLALYFGETFPAADDRLFLDSLSQLKEISQVAQEQLKNFEAHPKSTAALGIIERLDEVIVKMGELVPSVRVIANWMKEQKINIAPGSLDVMINQTRASYQHLDQVVARYISDRSDSFASVPENL